jgi:hypothetical protein
VQARYSESAVFVDLDAVGIVAWPGRVSPSWCGGQGSDWVGDDDETVGYRVLGVLVAAGLVVVAIVWGRNGMELVSWVAGVASLVVAVVTVLATSPSRSGASETGRMQHFLAKARDDGQVFQAGGNITNVGNRPPKR